MTRETQAYLLNTHVTNRINEGYRMLVRKKPTDVDDARDCNILTVLTGMNYNSIYVVGCGLGDILINLKRLKPESTVGGCETSDAFRSFGDAHFNISKQGVDFDIKEPPYHTLPQADAMVSITYLEQNPESVEVFKDMLSKSKYVVLFDQYPVRKFIEEQCGDLFHITEEEDYTIYSKKQTRRIFGGGNLAVGFSRLQASGAPPNYDYGVDSIFGGGPCSG